MTAEDVELILNEFERVKLLFRWTDGEGKTWGYWTGIDKPGRLPGKSRRGKNEPVGPEPPQEELRKFLESNGIQKLPGFGLGFGSGSGVPHSNKKRSRGAPVSGRPADFVDDFDQFWQAWPKKKAKKPAQRAWRKLRPPPELRQQILAAIERQSQTQQWKRGVIPNPATWLNDERWNDEISSDNGQGPNWIEEIQLT